MSAQAVLTPEVAPNGAATKGTTTNGTATNGVTPNVVNLDELPPIPSITSFQMKGMDAKLQPPSHLSFIKELSQPPPLGPLAAFKGTWTGTGFNTIFRPRNKSSNTKLATPLALGGFPDDNLLELNLTSETLTFSAPLGEVPNRGLNGQADIFLNGVPYTQSIVDVTNTVTGKADIAPAKADGIHFESGLWMFIPASTVDPVIEAQVCRMASIPHGSTISARGSATPTVSQGAPNFPVVDITPGPRFPNQTAASQNTVRLPQDLTKFIANNVITQDMLNDPNTVLRNANKDKKILQNTSFTVVSQLPVTNKATGKIDGDPTPDNTNIPFLRGDSTGPNAVTAVVSATFWISTVQHTIAIPPWKPGSPFPIVTPANGGPGSPRQPIFQVQPNREVTGIKTLTAISTQIQYSQTVVLQFNGLNWPHVSVATLVPASPIPVPFSVS